MTTSSKKFIGLFIIIIVFAVFLVLRPKTTLTPISNTEVESTQIKNPDLSTLPIFKNGLVSSGVNLDNLGYHTFSPDGKYFVFTGIKDTDLIPAKTYLVVLATGEVKELPGIMLRSVEDSRIITLFKDQDLVLYDPATELSENIPTDGNIFSGVLSPDGKRYVFDTLAGVKVYNRTAETTESLSATQYDGASAWFADSTRMLGFKNNGKARFEAGYGRSLGIWNIDTKVFTPFSPTILSKIPTDLIRSTTWIVPGTIARINTGWDDGSHDYLFNLATEEFTDLGETSGALMGGMKEDSSLGLFAIVNSIEGQNPKVTATIYKGMDKIASVELPTGFIRESVQIINEDSLLYIRKRLDQKQTIENVALVKLDVKTGTETLLKDIPTNFYSVASITPDRKNWVINNKNEFLVGAIVQ
ncbi:MAG: hypothetical protein M3Q34_03900 [bacterium]|nr:hypothetical protein [bacterium]